MKSLDVHYSRMLEVGFIVLREATQSGRSQWTDAEIEMLHNLPSLIGEANLKRHEYYWFTERAAYMQWASQPENSPARSRMEAFYVPIWNEMEPLLLEQVEAAEANAGR